MTPRLRMLAGPNGSGKSTLAQQLVDDYAVNLYKFLNADMLFAEISRSCKTPCPFSIDNQELLDFINTSTYPEECKLPFRELQIVIDEESSKFNFKDLLDYRYIVYLFFYFYLFPKG